MGTDSKIEWCHHTFNPWMGCQKVSPGCDLCYAETLMDTRYGKVQWGPHGERIRTAPSNWRNPYRWAKASRALPFGNRPRVFCASLGDVFDNRVPHLWRTDLYKVIEDTPELDWLLLTKRPENIQQMLVETIDGWAENPWPNVWLGFTGEDQKHFWQRWSVMVKIPAAVRFCSYEPAIGPLRLYNEKFGYEAVRGKLDWLICGGESGHGHRHLMPEWEYSIRRDCELAGIAYFFKQLSGKRPIPDGFPLVRQFPQRRAA